MPSGSSKRHYIPHAIDMQVTQSSVTSFIITVSLHKVHDGRNGTLLQEVTWVAYELYSYRMYYVCT
jgi:hypothetical protein